MKRWIKMLLWVCGTLTMLLLAVIILISPIARYLIEKNGEKYTGRQLKLNGLSINLLNGHVVLQGFQMMEADKKNLFVGCDTLAIDVDLMQYLFSSKLNVNYININGLTATIEQNGSVFNFDDILKKFNSSDTVAKDTTPSEPFRYFIHNISLKNGHFIYRDQQIGSEVGIIKATLFTPILAWNDPKMSYDFSFELQSKGEVKGNFSFITETMDYLMTLKSKALNLAVINPYLKGYLSISAFEGDIDSDLKLKGNFNKPSAIAVKGMVAVNNLLVDDPDHQKTLAWNQLKVVVDSLNTDQNIYNLSSITLSDPYILFEMYDKGGNNFYKMMNMGPDTSAVIASGGEVSASSSPNPFKMLVDLIGDMTKEYIITDYNIDRLLITGGTLLYKDYTLDDKFQYEMEELNLESSGIRSESEKVSASLHSKLNNLGRLEMLATINPKDFKNMELICRIQDAPVPDFSPYSKYYVAHPFKNGRISFTSENKLVNNFLTSDNKLSIARMEVGKKIKNKNAVNVPLRLAVSLLKDLKGNIKLEVPVEGNLNDPKYKLSKAVWGIVENILVKAATAPFRLLAATFGANEDELKELPFEYLQTSLNAAQIKSLSKLGDILAAKPELNLEITQTAIKEAEKERLAIFTAKKKYFRSLHPGPDSLLSDEMKQLDQISLKDSLFNIFLDQQLKLAPGNQQPALKKCISFSGEAYLNLQVNNNFSRREAYLSEYLQKTKKISPDRIHFLPVDEKSITAETPPKMVFAVKSEE